MSTIRPSRTTTPSEKAEAASGRRRQEALLADSLLVAVPLWIVRHERNPPPPERASELTEAVAATGDVVQFRSKRPGDTGAAFNHLAEGIALLARIEGGVTFSGLHWCTRHHHMGVRADRPVCPCPAMDDVANEPPIQSAAGGTGAVRPGSKPHPTSTA